MKKIKINGAKELTGSIKISGAKNSAVALIPAALLSSGTVTIDNIPNVSDIESLVTILEFLGADVKREDNMITIDSSNIVNKPITDEISK